MATSESQKRAVRRYRAKNYDPVSFAVKKGKRDIYKNAAATLGLSLAAFLTKAADDYARQHAGENSIPAPPPKPEPEKITAYQRRLLDAVSKLSPQAQKQLLKFIDSLA